MTIEQRELCIRLYCVPEELREKVVYVRGRLGPRGAAMDLRLRRCLWGIGQPGALELGFPGLRTRKFGCDDPQQGVRMVAQCL
jgi:hypothetical protein